MLRRGLFKKGRRKKDSVVNSESTDKTSSKDKVFQSFKRKKKKGKPQAENGNPDSEKTSITVSEGGLEVDRRMVSSDETASSKSSKGVPEPLLHHHGEDGEDPAVLACYDAVPLLEISKLPRGGVTMETQAVGRVQVSNRV